MPPRKLSDEEIAAVLDELRTEAKRLGRPPYELFTTAHVAERIKQRYGVKYNQGNVWRRMVNAGWQFRRSPLTYEERMAAYEAKYGKRRGR